MRRRDPGAALARIDLKRRQLVLHKTKNTDRRSVSIVLAVAELLEQHAKVRRLDIDLVFAQPGKMKPVEINHWFELALAEAGISDFRFHEPMNDRALPPDVARTAAQALMRAAKDAFTRVATDVLYNRPGSEERVRQALEELAAARAELATLDAPQLDQLAGDP